MFAKWREMDTRVRAVLQDGMLLVDSQQQPVTDGLQNGSDEQKPQSGTNQHLHDLRKRLDDFAWTHTDRQARLCQSYTPRYENGKYPNRDQYSVAISFHNQDRLPYLPKLVEHYLLSPK